MPPDPAATAALAQKVALDTLTLRNADAWAAMGRLLGDAGVPGRCRPDVMRAAWAERKRLRRRNPDIPDCVT